MIQVEGLTKDYRVYRKEPGLASSLKALVRRRFETVRAVDDVSFKIEAGEMVGFLGANGAGKTTTLKMLSGLLHPSAGDARVAGFVPKLRQRDFLCAIALVMGQKSQLDWDLPPADEYLLNQAIYAIPDALYRKRLDELVGVLALGDLIKRPTRNLSLGERMKCELIAALLHQPKVLFLDEPTIGLDVTMQAAVRAFLIEHNQRHGTTLLLTSHYMADVTAIARRVLVIDGGRLVFDGALRALSARIAPLRILRLTLAKAVATEALTGIGHLRKATELVVELAVSQEKLVAAAERALETLPIVDLTIEEVPVEEIVGSLFGSKGRSP